MTQRPDSFIVHQYLDNGDNYNFLLHWPNINKTAVVDPSSFDETLKQLQRKGWQLDLILQTHHHYDHIGGTEKLVAKFQCPVWAPLHEDRIPCVTRGIAPNENLQLFGSHVQVLSLPGHTLHHCAYWFPKDGFLFSGDVLFAMGCGRIFEGTPQQMFTALQRLTTLPDETQVFCAHEYTLSNGNFAMSVEPNNPNLKKRMLEVEALRSQSLPTVPTTIDLEKKTNPFLRTNSPEIRAHLGMTKATEVEVFATLRSKKDHF